MTVASLPAPPAWLVLHVTLPFMLNYQQRLFLILVTVECACDRLRCTTSTVRSRALSCRLRHGPCRVRPDLNFESSRAQRIRRLGTPFIFLFRCSLPQWPSVSVSAAVPVTDRYLAAAVVSFCLRVLRVRCVRVRCLSLAWSCAIVVFVVCVESFRPSVGG